MNHFKDFLIKLQTIDIKIIPKKEATYQQREKPAHYDLSHQSPHMSDAYRNSFRELRELALTDILNLPPEQILFQLKRLDELKELFKTFWRNRDTSPYTEDGEDNSPFLYNLKLDRSFIVPHLSCRNGAVASMYFIDDLKDTIHSRETILREFVQSVLRILPVPKEPENLPVKQVKPLEKAKPVFKEGAAADFFVVVKDYFPPDDQPRLKALLTSGTDEGALLLFKGKANGLADAFKQLFEANLIVGCNKAELIHWIIKHFSFADKGAAKSFTEKYLMDIIASNTKSCASPILDVRKKEGLFYIFPVQKNNRNNKK